MDSMFCPRQMGKPGARTTLHAVQDNREAPNFTTINVGKRIAVLGQGIPVGAFSAVLAFRFQAANFKSASVNFDQASPERIDTMDVDRSMSKYITRYSLIDQDTGQKIITQTVSDDDVFGIALAMIIFKGIFLQIGDAADVSR